MVTIESVCNQALDVIGEKRHIGNINEGSTVARIALNAWGQTRDGLLNKMMPIWAHKDATLVLLKTAPTDYGMQPWTDAFPELPWRFEYEYPSDCIQPLQIKGQLIFIPNFRPRAIPFRLNFDASANNRSILCNEPNAILTYVTQVLDPDDWHNEFIDAMILELAGKFKGGLADMKEPANARNNSG